MKTLDYSGQHLGDREVIELVKQLHHRSEVTSLKLWANHIGDSGAIALSTLSQLESLDVSSNRIGPKGAKALSQLPLTTLTLSRNPIGDEGIAEFQNTKTLVNLVASACSISSVTALLENNTTLKRCDLSGNRIEPLCPNTLEHLTLNATRVSEAVLSSLTPSSLSLVGNQLGDRDISILCDHPKRVFLDLTQNDLSNKSVSLLVKHSALQTLVVMDNQISDQGFSELLSSKLEFFNVAENPIIHFSGIDESPFSTDDLANFFRKRS